MALARSKALAEGDLNAALREIVETAARTLAVERVSIWLYTEDRTAVHCAAQYRLSTGAHAPGGELRPADYPAHFRALARARVIAADDARTDRRTRELTDTCLVPFGTVSMIDVPVRTGGRVVGLICHEHVGGLRQWTADEQQFAGSMADFVALALEAHERRRLTGEAARTRQGEQRALEARARLAIFAADVNYALSQGRTLHDMLHGCVDAMVAHLGAAFARIWVCNEAEQVLELRASAGMYTHLDGAHSRVGLGELKIGRIARDREPHLTNQVIGDPFINDQAWAKREGMVAFAGYPLLDGDRLVGVVALFARRELSESILHEIAAVATPIAQGIERLRVEEEQRESEERFALAVAGANDGIWDLKMDGPSLYLSPRCRAIFGFTEDEVAPDPAVWAVRVHPDDARRLIADVRAHVEGRAEHFSSEYRVLHKDGTYRWVLVRGAATRDAGGHYARLAGSLTDVTERRGVETHLRLLETAVANLNDLVILLGADQRIVYVNAAFERALGYSPDEVKGRTLDLLCGAKTDPAAFAHLRAGVAERRHVRQEIVATAKGGGPHWLEVDVTPFGDPGRDGAHCVAVARDLTTRKHLEERLFESQQMEGLGRMTGAVAHDFNNQLTVIKGYVQFLLDPLPPDDPRRLDLEQIRATVERGSRLVRHLLAVGRRRKSGRELLDIGTLVKEMAPVMEVFLGRGIPLQISCDPALLPVRAEHVQIERVLMNLVANAKDALAPLAARKQPTAVSILAANVELQEADMRALHTVREPGPYVMLAVGDTGAGMSPEAQRHLFEPYFTTKERGVGLGLPTVAQIVERLGGFVTCRTDPGAGTTFSVYLPVRRERPDASPSAGDHPAVFRGRPSAGAVVLVAEDQEEVREVLRRALEAAGYAVYTAADAAEAEHVAGALARPVDVLVADLMMPGGGGLALTRRLRAQQPGLPVLLISGYFDAHGLAAAVGGASFLRKPFGPDDLLRAVRDMVDRPEARS